MEGSLPQAADEKGVGGKASTTEGPDRMTKHLTHSYIATQHNLSVIRCSLRCWAVVLHMSKSQERAKRKTGVAAPVCYITVSNLF